MPNYRITGPDGAVYRVTAPEGATEDEVMQRVQAEAQAGSKPKGPTANDRKQFANDAFDRDDNTLEFATPFGRLDTHLPIAKIPLVGNSLPKALANLGAGFDSAYQGAKGLFGQGGSDDQIKEKRKQDEALADTTFGGGLLQVAGEALPTMVVPFGTGARVAGAGLRGAAAGLNAVRASGGAARVAGAARALEGGMPRLLFDNAAMGAVGGALGPTTSDESRLGNATLGATVGAALPAAGRLIRGGYETVTRGGAANKAAREVREAITDAGGTTAGVEQRLRDYATDAAAGGAEHIPLTSAGASGNTGIARLEAGARTRNGSHFTDVDQNQMRRINDAFNRDTAEAGELAARRGRRAGEWDANWQQAQDAAQPEVWAQRMPEFRRNLDTAMRSPEASNPQVRNVLNTVADEIDRLGDDFTPAHLQQIRANLNQRGAAAHVASPNAYQAAPRESAAVNSLLQEVDDVMNATTSGAWGGVTDAYRAGSREVDASKAAARVRERFFDSTNAIKGKSFDPNGDLAGITEDALSKAIARGEGPNKISQLSPDARRGLDQTLAAIRKQGIVQGVKKSATAGGGSNTASDQFAASALEAIPGLNQGPLGAVFSGLSKFAQRRKDAAMVEALRNPQAMQALLQRATRAPGDLTTAERELVKAMRQFNAVGANDALE